MDTHATSPSPGLIAALAGGLALLLCCAVAGAVLAAGIVTGSPSHGHAAAAAGTTFSVGEDVPTSFGFIAVEHAETFKGLTPRELGGATHGIGDFVSRDKALVQASVTITNTTAETLRYSPAQFRLVAAGRDGKLKNFKISHASVKAGVLQPDAAVDARLSFIAPRDGSRLAVQFADPGQDVPVTVALGKDAGTVTAAERRQIAQGHGTGGHDHGSDAN
jgi:hypothetical protein